MRKSWAHEFQNTIFPDINEERFAVLYSDKPSRPNTPINVIIGGLLIKELNNLTDEELVAQIHFNTEYQYVL
ncbi:transposase [Halarsenatibacter silvermanii]|uniref:Transposase domain n=1 Tax=Halarsenatibacter silvermanii TaxID=321763 RepID=A0A1G9K3J8_9FIRM|nr:transposase [Halarsenatibacter silvermanii]SDL44480.1 Transposase domain [Halarsenatibacter silvermanii]